MNPILQTLNQSNMSRIGQAKQMAQMFKSASNPNALVNQMMSQNPQVRQIINQYGGDPKTAFYKYAEANGIDPNDVLGMLK
jgi:hypothetical protein